MFNIFNVTTSLIDKFSIYFFLRENKLWAMNFQTENLKVKIQKENTFTEEMDTVVC